MDGWVDGWMDGRTDCSLEWIVKQMNGRVIRNIPAPFAQNGSPLMHDFIRVQNW